MGGERDHEVETLPENATVVHKSVMIPLYTHSLLHSAWVSVTGLQVVKTLFGRHGKQIF